MARPKGSRNKTSSQTIDERIKALMAEIDSLQERLKEKKAELRRLNAEKSKEGQKQILEAVAASGKSVDEILALISGEPKEV